MKKHLLLLFFLCLSHSIWGNIYFKHLGKPEGLSSFSVLSICQDELGRMWFGTLEGVSCYDGNAVNVYKPSLIDNADFLGNEVGNIVSDKNGSVFFTSDGMLVRYDIYKEQFFPLQQRASCLNVCGKDVYAATRDTVFRWDAGAERFLPIYHMKSQRNISCLYVDVNNSLWLGTSTGLYRLSGSDRQEPVCVIPRVPIHSLYRDSKGRMWVATFRRGMYRVENGIASPYPAEGGQSLSSEDVRCFAEDNEGNIWAGTFNALNKIDSLGNISYYKRDLLPGSLTHSSVFSLYKDVQGSIWVGTYYGGVHYFNPGKDIFRHYSENVNRTDCLGFFFIGKMAEDKRGNLWICTEGGGLDQLNRSTGAFTHYPANGHPRGVPHSNLKCIAYDKKRDCLYIGTHKQGYFRFDIPTERAVSYDEASGSSFADMILRDDSLYILSGQGLLVKNLQENSAAKRLYPDIRETHSDGSSLLIDSKQYIWIAQRNRVVRINMKNPAERYVYKNGENGLGKFQVLKIVEDETGAIFLGTNGSGLYEYNEQQNNFAPCPTVHARYCYNILTTPQNYLAIQCEHGLIISHPRTGEMKLIDVERQLHLSGFNDGCGMLLCSDGEMYVGGVNGMTSFMNTDLSVPSSQYELYFSSLMVDNQVVKAGAPDGILSTSLPFARKIDLNHNKNKFSISFTSNNYVDDATNRKIYEYMLEGLDEKWMLSLHNTITYTNLSPGDYTLIVREGGDGGHSARLQVTVHSPWYANWIAYLAYFILLSALIFAWAHNQYSKAQLRASLAQEKFEKEKSAELNELKLQFFANISHEFRTPLTLIISRLESLLQSDALSQSLRLRIKEVYKTTFQLRELITELLSFRKLEHGKIHLNVCHADLIPYLREIYRDFRGNAQMRNITFGFRTETDRLMGWYDPKQLKKVISNLLTNAFKYTPEKGKVDLCVEEKEDTIEIKVIDNGEGIPEESLPFIFERFYQSQSSSASPLGIGIGLALTKGLVELHHGEISVTSACGYGSIFTVALPKQNLFADDAYVTIVEPDDVSTPEGNWLPMDEAEGASVSEEDTADSNEAPADSNETPGTESDEALSESNEAPGEKPCVLLVEDNEDLLQILISLLSPLYRVLIAMNGKDGYDRAVEERPDLILSDVMMPVMSGFEMCAKIKNSFDLCHIPVILLTALTSDNKKMEGLQCGADDYVEKPFSNKMLLGHIANMIRNRNLLKKKFGESIAPSASTDTEMQALALNPIDSKFLSKLNEIVKQHLSDADFDVNLLARELGVSRSSLYNKLKALGSMTPNEFVLKERLKLAAELLQNQPDLQITEIAFQTGFNSLRYFRHCFKAHFNRTPQEYRNNS